MKTRNGIRLSVLAAAAALMAGCAGSADRAAETGAGATAHPLAISWGVNGEGYGRAVWNASAKAGDFRFQLHDRERDSGVSTTFVNRCYGHWSAVSSVSDGGGDADTADFAGTWRIHCTSGRIAQGSLVLDGTGGGRGEGFDREGRLVRLAFGPVEAASDGESPGEPAE